MFLCASAYKRPMWYNSATDCNRLIGPLVVAQHQCVRCCWKTKVAAPKIESFMLFYFMALYACGLQIAHSWFAVVVRAVVACFYRIIAILKHATVEQWAHSHMANCAKQIGVFTYFRKHSTRIHTYIQVHMYLCTYDRILIQCSGKFEWLEKSLIKWMLFTSICIFILTLLLISIGCSYLRIT